MASGLLLFPIALESRLCHDDSCAIPPNERIGSPDYESTGSECSPPNKIPSMDPTSYNP